MSPQVTITQTNTGFTEAAVEMEWSILPDSYIDCYNVTVTGQRPVCVRSNTFSTTVRYSYLEQSEVSVSLCAIDVCGQEADVTHMTGSLVPHAGKTT